MPQVTVKMQAVSAHIHVESLRKHVVTPTKHAVMHPILARKINLVLPR